MQVRPSTCLTPCPDSPRARSPRPARRRSSPPTRPRCCGATRARSAITSRSSSATASGRTPSTTRSRAGSRRCSSSGSPPDAPRHVAVLLDNTPDYLFAFGGAALIGGAVVGLNHTRRDEHLLRDALHTHCGLVLTEPRHEALLAPIADGLPPILSSDRFAEPGRCRRRARRVARRRARAARRRGRSRPRTRRRLDLGVDLHVGHVGRAEGGDLLAAAAARHRQAHVDDHGPRPRRRRLRVHAAVPLERGAGRVGAVARRRRARSGSAGGSRRRGWLPDVRHYGATYTNYTGKPLAYLLAQPERADDADNTLRVAFGNEGSPEVVDGFARRFGLEVIDAYGATEGGVAVNRDAGDAARRARPRARSRAGRRRRRQREAARRDRRARPRAQRGGERRRDRQHAGRRAVRGLLQERRRDREDDALRLVLVGRPRLQGRARASSTSRAATPTGSASTARTSRPARSRRRCARRPAWWSPRSTACPTTRPATR